MNFHGRNRMMGWGGRSRAPAPAGKHHLLNSVSRESDSRDFSGGSMAGNHRGGSGLAGALRGADQRPATPPARGAPPLRPAPRAPRRPCQPWGPRGSRGPRESSGLRLTDPGRPAALYSSGLAEARGADPRHATRRVAEIRASLLPPRAPRPHALLQSAYGGITPPLAHR
jgi:hypothetical protein